MKYVLSDEQKTKMVELQEEEIRVCTEELQDALRCLPMHIKMRYLLLHSNTNEFEFTGKDEKYFQETLNQIAIKKDKPEVKQNIG